MNVTLLDEQTSKMGKISDPDILTGSRYEKEFGLFDSVFHEVSNAIVIISNEQKNYPPIIEDVNHHFELVTGYHLDNIHNKSLFDFLAETKTSPHRHVINKALKSRQTAVVFCPWIDSAGRELDINMTLRPFSSDDDCSRFICVLRENSTENNHRNKAAKEIKKNLLAAMHHNFRTPLNGILGYSEVIMTEMLGPIGQASYRSYAEDIHGAGQDLLTLIDNLLDLKELETTEFELHEETFLISEMITACLTKVSEEARNRNIDLTCSIDPSLPPLSGDKSRLQQAIHSLLTNALKFTSPGGKIQIDVTRDKDGSCQISCEDNGAGMPPQQLAKVFCHDTHLSNIYSNPTIGIGFGLSYVKQMTEKHNGTVSIISSPGKGTTVTLYLPADRFR